MEQKFYERVRRGHMHFSFEAISKPEPWIYQDRRAASLPHLSEHRSPAPPTPSSPYAESLFYTPQTAASLQFLPNCTTAQLWAKGYYACISLKYVLNSCCPRDLSCNLSTKAVNINLGHLFDLAAFISTNNCNEPEIPPRKETPMFIITRKKKSSGYIFNCSWLVVQLF